MNIICEIGKIWEFDELPQKSIALDGAVRGPLIDNKNKKYSFDHHDNCIRHCTSATCTQVMDAILLGFENNDYNIYINDIDGDTVLSLAILRFPEIVEQIENQEFIRNIGLLDAHGPSYPFHEKFLTQLNYFNQNILENFNKRNLPTDYSDKKMSEMIIKFTDNFKNWCEKRLEISNDINLVEKNYEIIYESKNDWLLVKSKDFIFGKIYKDGYTKAIVFSESINNSFAYTIGKKSEFVDFPVRDLLDELNKYEVGWGGGSTVGGAPRNHDGSRSKLKPEELIKLVEDFFEKL